MELVSGIERNAEEVVTEMSVDDLLESAAGLSDMQCAVPLGDRREVRGDEAFDVVVCDVGQFVGVLDQEAGSAVQRTPDPERDREWIAAFERPVARAHQSVSRATSGAQHEVTGER